jgi:hypothetical protein
VLGGRLLARRSLLGDGAKPSRRAPG